MLVVEAYIFINSDPTTLWEIAETAHKIKGVKMAHAVTGQYDVVAYAEFPNIESLKEIIWEFQTLKGVQGTRTAVAISPRLE